MIIKIENGVPRHPLWRMAEPINLEIKRGEQIAIVGDNAAGKSRLVEVLTGHYPLLQNEVHYEFSSSKLRLVSENLKYISFRDAYGPQNSTYYYQRRWNLGDQSEEDSPLIVLSSGELRKYQINKALASNPRILILDNPFIGLDAPSRKDFRELLERLTRETELLVILVLSKRDDIPDFITHVLPIEGLRLLPKMTLEEYRKQYTALPKPQLNEKIKNWIADLPVRELNDSDFYPASGGEILRFKDVSIKYGNRTILQPLNWTVHEGERWALTGKNGSGKSTLLSLVCADNPQAYACDIQLFGHRRGTGESIWEIKRHIGYVSPEMHRAYLKDIPAIDVVASGLNDSVGLYVRPKPEQKQICLDWMQVFGVEEVSDRSFLQLSSGEQRLCLLARAFVKDPELLILDEPLHGLDDRNRELVRQIIEQFCLRPRKTLVMVSHYEEELPHCIDHRLRL
ncbi:MAG: ATP-binding cassette domain-containing protein [Bacteroidaceae bacterium]|nr:ATP-binding cassette domain-containing protein [Bacteroidaceae bacterium]